MRAFREQLVLDMDAGDAGGGELAHRTHCMQRLAEPRPGIGDERYPDGPRDLARDPHLLVHCQQGLGNRARGAGSITAGVDRLDADRLGQPPFDRRRR